MSKDISKYMLLWAELVDMGEMCALGMIRNTQPTLNPVVVLKRALKEQSEVHHQTNIEILRKLSK